MGRKKPSVYDVASYILGTLGSMSTMKLQKLVYYSAAYSAAWLERPLFDEAIEAWQYGPVVRDLYRTHRRKYSIDLGEYLEAARRIGVEPAPWNLRKADSMVVDSVIAAFGELSGLELSERTHQEQPWKQAFSEGNNTLITFEALREYYAPQR